MIMREAHGDVDDADLDGISFVCQETGRCQEQAACAGRRREMRNRLLQCIERDARFAVAGPEHTLRSLLGHFRGGVLIADVAFRDGVIQRQCLKAAPSFWSIMASVCA